MSHTEPSWSAVTGAVRVLQRAGSLEQATSAHLRSHGMGLSMFLLLAVLVDRPAATVRNADVVEWLGLTTGGGTRLIARARARGFIYRVPNPDDKRSQLITLTTYGYQRLAQATPGFVDLVAGIEVNA